VPAAMFISNVPAKHCSERVRRFKAANASACAMCHLQGA
jgi:hypothetical protein